MRTSRFACIAVVLTLLGASVSFGVSAGAFADSSDSYDEDSDSLFYSVTTSVYGVFNWSYSLQAYASATISGSVAGSSYAVAAAQANVTGIASDSVSAHMAFFGTIASDSMGDSASDSGLRRMFPGDGLFFSELCDATASWDSPDGGCVAYAASNASASGGIW